MYPNKSVAYLLLIGLVLQLTLALADVSHLDYSQLGAYHYPVPRLQQLQQQRQQHQVARQFVDPSLEHAAFTQVLTRSGYVFGGGSGGSQAAASAPFSAALPVTGRSIGSPAHLADSNSLNLKLPVPFGLMPLNVANLPLQAGASYATVPHTTGLTSYGTAQIQRR